ncbi:glycoside hydrolase family 16 protein [Sphingobacterium puteale]|uniref:glycoside hydrolase family 16 protein n=1 Tax=Sphingobacterium puteale TaxID=2420510 RepID=UPI001C7D3497|nr:glycoside hydrolase family 16 protein [Sphingobacterium puteale]
MKIYIFLASIQVLSALGLLAQTAKSDIPLQLLGTRSWIRVDLDDNQPNMTGTKVFWAKTNKKPQTTNAILADGARRYYIQQVDPETAYYIWVESATGKSLANGKVHTSKTWQLDDMELGEVQKNPSSRAVPLGMEVYWQDEFNDRLLNRNKWTTNYFSSLNYLNEKSKQEMLQNQLPQPAYTLDGSAINLYVNDTIPKRIFTEGGNQKISSIQTYDWKTNENLLDNSKGGYFEVKVRRNRQGNPKGTNTAFWFDSPGPDIRYYLQEGAEVDGIKGIRPKGQLFEIDVFEYITAQFVIHGHVDTKGVFQRNLATHIAEGYEHVGQWVTHGVLWTPTSVKHYINGDLIKEYDDKNQIYSPNHFMNVFLGTYGSEGGVNMEVDYIRAYNWPLRDGNELPNPDFEGKAGLKPWEGDGTIAEGIGEKGSKALVLAQGKKIEQYIYLDPAQQFNLRYWGRGGSIAVTVDDVKVVSGELSNLKQQTLELGKKGKKQEINFVTGQEINPNKKIVRIAFTNTGKETIYLDNITVKKK